VRTTRKAAIAAAAVIVAAVVLHRLSRLPDRAPDPEPRPIDGATTTLGRSTAKRTHAHPGLSGLSLLSDAHDAFAARMLLARAAEASLDLQYYIWHGDRTGTLLLETALEAAERGVRVRLLLDDNGIAGLDGILAALDAHPRIAVRLFNPFAIRFPKAIGYLVDFTRLNRRMHNKTFTVDNAVTIVGGRNIGDEYFGAGDGGLFADLDVLAIGPAVADVAADFERYWHCASAYPAASILRPAPPSRRRKLRRRASIVARDRTARRFVARVRALPLVRQLIAGELPLDWAKVRMISDDPAKALGNADPGSLLAGKLDRAVGTPRRELGIMSGYFVPGDAGTAELCRLAESGVAVSILTNAFEATDVGIVHAGYAPSRIALLKAGVRLFEMRGSVRERVGRKARRRGHRLGIGSSLRGSGSGSVAALRSSAATLHAKTFTVDRERLFVGSFNLDPRSVDLNTELGFLIESPALAGRVADTFVEAVPQSAYAVTLGPEGALRWQEQDGRTSIVHDREPGMRWIDRAGIAIAERLPIRWLL
jgi:putative cardiolipin synthase